MNKRDKTRPQDEYCKDCLIYQEGACNVILKDDEDECGDKVKNEVKET